jgi:hypothetical protein
MCCAHAGRSSFHPPRRGFEVIKAKGPLNWLDGEVAPRPGKRAYPDHAMADQPDYMLRWERFDKVLPHESGKVLICGHTPKPSGRPLNRGYAICIDTHAYGGGCLTALETNSGRIWQANAAGRVGQAHVSDFSGRIGRIMSIWRRGGGSIRSRRWQVGCATALKQWAWELRPTRGVASNRSLASTRSHRWALQPHPGWPEFDCWNPRCPSRYCFSNVILMSPTITSLFPSPSTFNAMRWSSGCSAGLPS